MVIQPQHFIIVDVVLYHSILGFDTTFGDILCDNSGDIFEAIFVDTSVDTSYATSGDSDIDESIAP